MKIYTRRGDKGRTSLFSGERVDKNALRVEAYGTIDELNSVLGLAAAQCTDPVVSQTLSQLQRRLFDAGADLATSLDSSRTIRRIAAQDWEELEHLIDRLDEELPPLKTFILPGGSVGASQLHLARAVSRRAERLIVELKLEEPVNPDLVTYVNRLSDFLFVLARYENVKGGGGEVKWES